MNPFPGDELVGGDSRPYACELAPPVLVCLKPAYPSRLVMIWLRFDDCWSLGIVCLQF